jgi:hypothetical protein
MAWSDVQLKDERLPPPGELLTDLRHPDVPGSPAAPVPGDEGLMGESARPLDSGGLLDDPLPDCRGG